MRSRDQWLARLRFDTAGHDGRVMIFNYAVDLSSHEQCRLALQWIDATAPWHRPKSK